VPAVGIAHDQVTARPVAGRIDRCHVEVEHALPVEVHEREVTRIPVLVVVDPDAESSALVERDRFGEIDHRQRRRRTHPKLTRHPVEAVAAELDVISRRECDDRVAIAATTRTLHRRSGHVSELMVEDHPSALRECIDERGLVSRRVGDAKRATDVCP
jgi:hypothetical protein